MKKSLLIIAVLTLLMPCVVGAQSPLEFISDADRADIERAVYLMEVTYKDTTYNTYSGDIFIPYHNNNYLIDEIGDCAFKDCEGLRGPQQDCYPLVSKGAVLQW